ncbi:hypothetical protein LY90DRAFT_501090 [Neocallimastix californiae]|uniref:GyrI-like small molecule binding domain-containing protein n=1 Tax=Neocallimastix californiae TaxID=1754190 RepID=A0A1Y2F3A6_9FUNG|nr:hypothetical protein LY90DRAFT_501090 [Neocallimastix californiae]|eukprot:ORY78323.1 hypothetical protein LY90DRAFT_501090 [Neocallimastix californiae]
MHELGFFYKINVIRDKVPKMTVAGIRFKGPYQNTGKPFNELEKKITEANIDVIYIGLYFDQVQNVPADKLRSFVGAIIKNPNEETLNKLKEMELEIIEIEENDESLQAYYPYTNMKILEPFSMMCAPMRVYPAMTKFLEQHPEVFKSGYDDYKGKNIPCFEIYDSVAGNTRYILQNKNAKEILPDFK